MSTSLSGNLSTLNLSEVISNTCLVAKSCQFIVKNSIGEGYIFFLEGKPYHARMGELIGNKAVHSLLASIKKEGGIFYIDFNENLPEKKTISTSWEKLISENPLEKDKNSFNEKREKNKDLLMKKNVTKRKEQKMISRGEAIVHILKELEVRSPDIEGTAVISTEGLVIASAMPEEMEEEHVAAISAIVLSLGERIVSELARGTLEQVYTKGEKGYVLIISCGSDALLVIIANQFAKLGMVFLDAKRTSKELVKFL
ncbi:MAG: roadblock/LC7 domain-containing protein [Candidatus Hodarchaeota archaeon]